MLPLSQCCLNRLNYVSTFRCEAQQPLTSWLTALSLAQTSSLVTASLKFPRVGWTLELEMGSCRSCSSVHLKLAPASQMANDWIMKKTNVALLFKWKQVWFHNANGRAGSIVVVPATGIHCITLNHQWKLNRPYIPAFSVATALSCDILFC